MSRQGWLPCSATGRATVILAILPTGRGNNERRPGFVPFKKMVGLSGKKSLSF
jgi:hypothetical protein